MTTKTDLQKQAAAATALPLETSREYAERLLTDGRFAMAETKGNPALFQAGRRDQIRLGRRAPNAHEKGQAIRSGWDGDALREGSLTQAQVQALAEFSLEQLKAISGTQVQEMKTSDPARYQLYRIAGATRGVLPASLLEKINTPDVVTTDQPLQAIPSLVAQALNLDPTLKVTSAGMDRALQEYAKVTAKQIIEQQSQEQAHIGALTPQEPEKVTE